MRHAFSLVELSIVLVILGLLTGGILSGQSLIRAAELRSVVTEFQHYQAAAATFRDKYMAPPGDITNATKFWQMAAAGATCITTASTDPRTCDGNGDGMLENSTTSNERFRFWQHLANAGLIEGSYNGIEGSSGNINHAVGGTNVPRAKLNNAVWHINWAGTTSGNPHIFNGEQGSLMQIGGQVATNSPTGAIFSPEEAWNIDSKLDDGNASQGKVWAGRWDDCTSATSAANLVDYDLTIKAPSCILTFRKVF